MASAFKAAIDFVLAREGGYVNDPSDPGGETNFGISKRAYPGLDIKALTREAALSIYYRAYWQGSGCEGLPPAVALIHFDTSVNQGVAAATRILQAAAGVTVDGKIGPKTLAAIAAKGAGLLVEEYAAHRMTRYGGTPNFDRYGLGWARRLMACVTLCHTLMESANGSR